MARKNHFIYMLIALIVFLVVLPVADGYVESHGAIWRALSFSCLLVVGVWSLQDSHLLFRVALLIVVIGLALNFLAVSPVKGTYIHGSLIILFLFLSLAIGASFRKVLFTDKLTFDRVIGAICIYLMLGSVWAIMYAFLELVNPGSFNGLSAVNPQDWNSDWLYFSFVTLTTLGYGDITPASHTAKVLVYTEAIFGTFYMAVMVAGLVSGYLSAKDADR